MPLCNLYLSWIKRLILGDIPRNDQKPAYCYHVDSAFLLFFWYEGGEAALPPRVGERKQIPN